MTPRSLRVARLLLVAAASAAVGSAVYIAVESSAPIAALPWISLFILLGAGFLGSAFLLEPDPRRARTLAVGSAVGLAAVGTVAGFGAGNVTFPAAAIGVLAAWAAQLHPPRRRMVLYFLAYLAVGLALNLPRLGFAILYPYVLATVLIWPVTLLLFPTGSILVIYSLLGIAASVLILAFTRGREGRGWLTIGGWLVLGAIALLGGVAAVAIFNTIAVARTDTSARFELDGLVLGVVFAGALLVALGLPLLRLAPGPFASFAIGLGAAALFMVFTYRPAVTCEVNGVGTSAPLAWVLRGGGSSGGSSGGSGSSISGTPAITAGHIDGGDRAIEFRCEGDRLVEYREVPR